MPFFWVWIAALAAIAAVLLASTFVNRGAALFNTIVWLLVILGSALLWRAFVDN